MVAEWLEHQITPSENVVSPQNTSLVDTYRCNLTLYDIHLNKVSSLIAISRCTVICTKIRKRLLQIYLKQDVHAQLHEIDDHDISSSLRCLTADDTLSHIMWKRELKCCADDNVDRYIQFGFNV